MKKTVVILSFIFLLCVLTAQGVKKATDEIWDGEAIMKCQHYQKDPVLFKACLGDELRSRKEETHEEKLSTTSIDKRNRIITRCSNYVWRYKQVNERHCYGGGRDRKCYQFQYKVPQKKCIVS